MVKLKLVLTGLARTGLTSHWPEEISLATANFQQMKEIPSPKKEGQKICEQFQ